MPYKTRSRPGRATWAQSARCRIGLLAVVLLAALAWPAYEALAAQPTVGLGTAGSFTVLAASAVTNTGPSTVSGELGVSPGTAVTGFPPGTVGAATHTADAAAAQAQTDLVTAYNDAAGRTPALTVSGNLGGLTLTPGVYKSGSSLGLTGQLTLDAQGNPGAVFIFQAGSTLTTASASDVKLVDGAQACNVYWQIGSSATLGTSSAFAGNILAYTSISMDNGVTVHGRALARNGAVTLIDDTLNSAQCAASAGTTPTSTTPTSTTPTSTTPTTTTTTPTRGVAAKRHNGTAILTTTPRSVVTTIDRHGIGECVRRTFRVAVTGLFIRRVVFSLDGKVIARRAKSPFQATVGALGGVRIITARVTYKDGTRPASLHLRFRACAAAAVITPPPAPPLIPSGFTG